ncbi:MAG: hypothetical protein JW834_00680 [Candidatus Diapherotrites archaeon]|nr:hypothetical protein [Candidatus Diapherotrites archaeon]
MTEKKLVVAVPHMGSLIPTKFMLSYLQMQKPCKNTIFVDMSKPLDMARNRLVASALQADATHVLFWDSDCVFPGDSLVRLMERDKPVAGGLYFEKTPNFLPVMYLHGDKFFSHIVEYPENELVKVDAVGMGFTLVKREVLEKVGEPWFKWTQRDGRTVGEDFFFCERVAEAGFDIFVDTGVKGRHIGDVDIGEAHFKQAINLMREAQKKD